VPVRFLHSADWQIGMPARFMSEEAATLYTESRFEAIRRIGQLARERGCEFVVVAGDVFDTNFLGRRTLLRAAEAMADVPVPLFLLPGNHDPLDASSVYDNPELAARLPARVRILRDDQPVVVRPGVEVVGAPWRTRRPVEDLLTAALRVLPADGTLRVAVGHGAVDQVMGVMRDEPATIRLEAVERALADGRAHYVALGDRHSTTRVGDSGRVWYSGTPEPTRFDETDPGNVLIVEVDDDDVQVERVPVGRWRFLEMAHAVHGPGDVDALERDLQAIADKHRTLVRLRLTGTVSMAVHADLVRRLAALEALFAGLEGADASDLEVQPDTVDIATLGLAGFARAALDELTAKAAGQGDEAQTARAALHLLYRLAGAGGRQA
jgi:DNA repair exonuclease SbcCD nuclease subunit